MGMTDKHRPALAVAPFTLAVLLATSFLVVWGYSPRSDYGWYHGWPLAWQVRFRYMSEESPTIHSPLSTALPFDGAPVVQSRWDFLLVDIVVLVMLVGATTIFTYGRLRTKRVRFAFGVSHLFAATASCASVVWLIAQFQQLEFSEFARAAALVVAYTGVCIFWFQLVAIAVFVVNRSQNSTEND